MGHDLGWDLLAVAAAATVTLLVAAETSVGPTVIGLTAGHGVHLGDLVAGAVAFGLAGAVIAGRRWPHLVR